METACSPIPEDWEAITPRWMTTALSDHFPGAEVSHVGLLFRDDRGPECPLTTLPVSGATPQAFWLLPNRHSHYGPDATGCVRN